VPGLTRAAVQTEAGLAAARSSSNAQAAQAGASVNSRAQVLSPDSAAQAGVRLASATGRTRLAAADAASVAASQAQADTRANPAASATGVDGAVAAAPSAAAGAADAAAQAAAAPGLAAASLAAQAAATPATAVTAATNDVGRSDAARGPARSTDRAAGQVDASRADLLRSDARPGPAADGVAGLAGPQPGQDRRIDASADGSGQQAAAWQQAASAAALPMPAATPAGAGERAAAALAALAQADATQASVDNLAPLQAQPLAVNGVAGAQPGMLVAGPQPGAAAPMEARIAVPLDQPGFGAALGTQVSVMVQGGVQTAQLQLNPAEMGPIAVQIALDGSAARVDFQADLASTRAVIEASLPALAGALQDAGFTLAGGGVFQQAPGSRQGQGDGQPQPGQPRLADGRADASDPSPGPALTLRSQRGLVDLIA
jgi:flagellar hook-length control protein FliK